MQSSPYHSNHFIGLLGKEFYFFIDILFTYIKSICHIFCLLYLVPYHLFAYYLQKKIQDLPQDIHIIPGPKRLLNVSNRMASSYYFYDFYDQINILIDRYNVPKIYNGQHHAMQTPSILFMPEWLIFTAIAKVINTRFYDAHLEIPHVDVPIIGLRLVINTLVMIANILLQIVWYLFLRHVIFGLLIIVATPIHMIVSFLASTFRFLLGLIGFSLHAVSIRFLSIVSIIGYLLWIAPQHVTVLSFVLASPWTLLFVLTLFLSGMHHLFLLIKPFDFMINPTALRLIDKYRHARVKSWQFILRYTQKIAPFFNSNYPHRDEMAYCVYRLFSDGRLFSAMMQPSYRIGKINIVDSTLVDVMGVLESMDRLDILAHISNFLPQLDAYRQHLHQPYRDQCDAFYSKIRELALRSSIGKGLYVKEHLYAVPSRDDAYVYHWGWLIAYHGPLLMTGLLWLVMPKHFMPWLMTYQVTIPFMLLLVAILIYALSLGVSYLICRSFEQGKKSRASRIKQEKTWHLSYLLPKSTFREICGVHTSIINEVLDEQLFYRNQRIAKKVRRSSMQSYRLIDASLKDTDKMLDSLDLMDTVSKHHDKDNHQSSRAIQGGIQALKSSRRKSVAFAKQCAKALPRIKSHQKKHRPDKSYPRKDMYEPMDVDPSHALR